MAGTKAGGLKAAATNKKRFGKNWYAEIGRKGGQNGHTGGFASMTPEQVRAAGRKGGLTSSKAPTLSLEERRREIAELLKNEEEMEAYETSL